METKKPDRKADALMALKSACVSEDQKKIVIGVLECILTAFSNFDNPCETQYGKDSSINGTQFVHDMNYFINEINNYNNK